ncbi:MAG TPA: hypothetical protein PLE48_00590 [Thiobacillus sp.]|nr:hypothetical protein [Thiobacillus sp.]HQT68906.1 hypothetical protein [Thiobacillus sp.]
MDAEIVIPVDLNSDQLGRHLKPRPHAGGKARKQAAAEPDSLTGAVLACLQSGISQLGINQHDGAEPPAMLDVLAPSINIMQVLITRSSQYWD